MKEEGKGKKEEEEVACLNGTLAGGATKSTTLIAALLQSRKKRLIKRPNVLQQLLFLKTYKKHDYPKKIISNTICQIMFYT